MEIEGQGQLQTLSNYVFILYLTVCFLIYLFNLTLQIYKKINIPPTILCQFHEPHQQCADVVPGEDCAIRWHNATKAVGWLIPVTRLNAAIVAYGSQA